MPSSYPEVVLTCYRPCAADEMDMLAAANALDMVHQHGTTRGECEVV